MPHSSGGGSYRGGFSSGFSGNRNSGFSRGYRRNNYHDSFVFYDKNMPMRKRSLGPLLPKIFAVILFIAVGLSLIYVAFSANFKLLGAKDTEIIIKDSANVLHNEEELRPILDEFAKKTGIIPIIMTVNNENWMSHYKNIEDYAYQLYMQSCNDECHWLIVYSEPKSAENMTFNDWHWQGMQGDKTDTILNSSVLNYFNICMQLCLANETKTVDRAFCESFEVANGMVMKAEPDYKYLCGGIVLLIFPAIAIVGMATGKF